MSLFDAIRKRDLDKCAQLIKEGADVNDESEGKIYPHLAPLGLALFYHYSDMAILLQKNGAVSIGFGSMDAFLNNNMYDLMEFYFELNVKHVNYINETGVPLLHRVIDKNDTKLVKMMLKYNANPNIQNLTNEETPLHRAMSQNTPNKKIVKLLLDYGANPNIYMEHFGYTDLQFSIKKRYDKITKIIRKSIERQTEENYLLVIVARELDESSLLHRDYLPLDMFKLIFGQIWFDFSIC